MDGDSSETLDFREDLADGVALDRRRVDCCTEGMMGSGRE